MSDAAGDDRRAGHANLVHAIVAAVRDIRQPRESPVSPVPEGVRVDGKTCLVTGANSGLGRAAAIELARRGGHVILACRPGHEETRGEIMQLSGSTTVDMIEVDLADLASVHRLCDRLVQEGTQIDIAVLNAGLAARTSRRSRQGYDLMFAVHFLSNRVMLDRWLRDGVVRPGCPGREIPRIVFITSESHRSAEPIDFDRLGAFVDYGIRGSLKQYGFTKLVQCTFARELSRRLNPGDEVEVAVHAICPGGVATNIAREAPPLLKPLLNTLFRHIFQSPEAAVAPVIYLCCAEAPGATTGMYLHMTQRKSASPSAADPENGRKLWEASETLVSEARDSG